MSDSLASLLRTLTTSQLSFVAARMDAGSDKAAAIEIGIAPQTVYNWSNKSDVMLAVRLAQLDSIEVGRERLRRLVYQAISVLKEEMAPDEKRRFDAARDVLDRTGLTAPTKLEIRSWRDEAQEQGLDPATVFEHYVQGAVIAIAAGDGKPDGGSVDRSQAATED